MVSQQFCLKWNNHTTNMLAVFENLLSTEALVDVTLACDGLSLKAHKMVLSACSPFFQSLFLENPCKHPIVIMKDMRYTDLKAIIDFMYRGEVNVSHDQLSALLKTAETLKVKGLAEVTGENRHASGIVQQEITQQSVSTPATNTPSTQRTDTPPLQGKRKRGRPRKRSLSDSNRSDDEGVASKIKEQDSDIEELSGDASMEASDIRSGGGPISSNSQSQVPIQTLSSSNVNSFSKSHHLPSMSQDPQVEEPASGDENEFEVEPSKLLEQTLTTDNVPSNSQNNTGHITLPSVSGLEISRRSMSSTDSQALVPASIPSDSLGSNLQGPDSPQDIKPQLLSFDDPPISPVAGPSHQSDRSMMMYMDQSSMPGPSNFQDSSLVPHDSQPQDYYNGNGIVDELPVILSYTSLPKDVQAIDIFSEHGTKGKAYSTPIPFIYTDSQVMLNSIKREDTEDVADVGYLMPRTQVQPRYLPNRRHWGRKKYVDIQCPHCHQSFHLISAYRKHLVKIHPEVDHSLESFNKFIKRFTKHPVLKCSFCEYVCTTEISLKRHQQNKHPDAEWTLTNKATSSTKQPKSNFVTKRPAFKEPFKCPYCKKIKLQVNSFRLHLLKTHPEVNHSPESFDNLVKNFTSIPVLRCSLCDYVCITESSHRTHQESKHPDNDLKATSSAKRPCNARTRRPAFKKPLESINKPLKSINKPLKSINKPLKSINKPLKCPHCTYSCITTKSYFAHQEILHANKGVTLPFKCHYCDFRYHKSRLYDRHLESVHPDGDMPDSRTPYERDLEAIASHTKEKKLERSEDNDLKQPDLANRRTRACLNREKKGQPPEINMKKYECPSCVYSCASVFALKRHLDSRHPPKIEGSHMIKHQKDRPYKCRYCAYSCLSEKTYENHANERHPSLEAAYTCFSCDFSSLCHESYAQHVSDGCHYKQPKQLSDNGCYEEEAKQLSAVGSHLEEVTQLSDEGCHLKEATRLSNKGCHEQEATQLSDDNCHKERARQLSDEGCYDEETT